ALALEAARRQADAAWTLAMLREWGQQALDRGDRPRALARWSEMLERVLANQGSPARPAPSPARGRAPRAPARSAGSGVPVATIDRFEQAAQVARLAATHEMFELSARAVGSSLRGGPPVFAVNLNAAVSPRLTGRGNAAPQAATEAAVERELGGLVSL